MSINIYVPLIAALIGAIIGAAASVATVIVQAHYQSKRELVKDAISTALEDWKLRMAIVTPRGGAMPPLVVFIQYHTELMRLAAQGKINPETLQLLHVEQERLIAAVKELNGRGGSAQL